MSSEEIPWLGVSFSFTVPYITVEMTTALKNTLSMLFEIVTSDASRWYHSEQLLDFLGSHIVPTSILLGENPQIVGFSKNTTRPTDFQTGLQKCEKSKVGNNCGNLTTLVKVRLSQVQREMTCVFDERRLSTQRNASKVLRERLLAEGLPCIHGTSVLNGTGVSSPSSSRSAPH